MRLTIQILIHHQIHHFTVASTTTVRQLRKLITSCTGLFAYALYKRQTRLRDDQTVAQIGVAFCLSCVCERTVAEGEYAGDEVRENHVEIGEGLRAEEGGSWNEWGLRDIWWG